MLYFGQLRRKMWVVIAGVINAARVYFLIKFGKVQIEQCHVRGSNRSLSLSNSWLPFHRSDCSNIAIYVLQFYKLGKAKTWVLSWNSSPLKDCFLFLAGLNEDIQGGRSTREILECARLTTLSFIDRNNNWLEIMLAHRKPLQIELRKIRIASIQPRARRTSNFEKFPSNFFIRRRFTRDDTGASF